ncbi:hypothetical protein B566_EDAN013314 [Ephemera danica]|nr:hypothetical protein B566_EDAN013314 [Ephemera danica]
MLERTVDYHGAVVYRNILPSIYIGILKVPRSSGCAATNNLPPLGFHSVHGDNIQLSRDGAIARRAESFCKGVTFSGRPVKVNEKVDLTNKTGYWAKALAERFATRGAILFFYVTAAGDVHFGVNGEEKGVFFSGVETRGPLWALLDLYGNCTAIELIDSRQQLNNCRRGTVTGASSTSSPLPVAPCPAAQSSPSSSPGHTDADRLILPSLLNSLSINSQTPREDSPPLAPRPQPPETILSPLPFHSRTRGRNIRHSYDRCVASRVDTEFCNGYVFTARPLQLGERIVIQGSLPDDSDLLLDRPEYWALSKDVASCPQRGEELAFTLLPSGEVTLSRSGSPPTTVMHVDQTLSLWAFFDVYGSTQRIRILGSQVPSSPPRLRVQLPTSPSPDSAAASNLSNARLAEASQGQPPSLVVNLPPCTGFPTPIPPQQQQQPTGGNTPPTPIAHVPSSSGTLLSTYSHTYIEPVAAGTRYSTLDSATGLGIAGTSGIWGEGTTGGNECSICYERSIDSVLYMCGHMCMCYECAVQQWRGKGGGHCPLCRAVIRDVIRTYKS